MCGISGIINKHNKPVQKEKIQKINNLISHRGPNDEGFYFQKNFAFGHRRLSILDLSNAGHQPMHYLDKYVITYNGEVYNYIELKEDLEKSGYTFISHTDTEVILASYDMWGQECVKKFNGMWAFAIYDKEQNVIFCSRDRFGIKPFYYTVVDESFIFGSELKQLLEFYQDRCVNSTILIDYILYGLVEHTNQTFFENIFKLEQSHNLVYDLNTNKFNVDKYYTLEIQEGLCELDEKQSINRLQNEIVNAIELRLRADVKVGTCLSGGLDSSTIAAIASKKYYDKTNKQFVGIHAKSVEKETDESHFAKEVAQYCNLELIVIEPTLQDITRYIEEVVYTQEEPFGGLSVFMQYFVMNKAKELGCIVMLDGQGGDETLFGYETYYSFYFASLLSRLRIFQFISELSSLKPFKLSKKQILKSTISVLLGHQSNHIKSILGLDLVNLKKCSNYNRGGLNGIFEFLKFKHFQKREIMQRNLPHLLRYEDKNSMRNSIETRLPFVDYKFVTSAISINDKLKFKDGYLKYLLRKVSEGILPKNIVWRSDKFGFEAPADTWMELHRDEMITTIIQSTLLNAFFEINLDRLKNNSLLWRFYNVALWQKIYNVKF